MNDLREAEFISNLQLIKKLGHHLIDNPNDTISDDQLKIIKEMKIQLDNLIFLNKQNNG